MTRRLRPRPARHSPIRAAGRAVHATTASTGRRAPARLGGDTGGHIGRAQAERLAVRSLPPGSHDQDRSPHVEPDEEQSVRHGRLVSFTYLIDSVTVNAAGDATICSAFQQQNRAEHDQDVRQPAAQLQLHRWAELPAGLRTSAGPGSLHRRTATTWSRSSATAQRRSVQHRGHRGSRLPSQLFQRRFRRPSRSVRRCAPSRSQGYWTQVSPAGARHAIGRQERDGVTRSAAGRRCHEVRELPRVVRRARRHPRDRQGNGQQSRTGLRAVPRSGSGDQRPPHSGHGREQHDDVRVDRRREVHPA